MGTIDVPVDDVLAQATECRLVSRHRVDGVVSVDDEQCAQLAVPNRVGRTEGPKPPFDEGGPPPVGRYRFDDRFEAVGDRGAKQFSSRAEVVVDVAAIDPGPFGDLAEIEAGQHAVAPDEVEGNADESPLGFVSISLGLRGHRSARLPRYFSSPVCESLRRRS